MVAARPKIRLVEWQDLLLDDNVLLQFAVDDVGRDLTDDLLQSDVALECLVEVLL